MDKAEIFIYVFIMIVGIGLTPQIFSYTTSTYLTSVGITGFTSQVLQVFPYLFLLGMICVPVIQIGRNLK